MGVLAALAGLIFAARLNTATPKAGLGFELDVIAACFIGGASASGGVGKVSGCCHWCLHHGRHEQRHVHHGHRHRLPAGHQGPGAAGGRVRRRLQQKQIRSKDMSSTMTPHKPRYPHLQRRLSGRPHHLHGQGELDLPGQMRCVDFMIDAGSNGLCILANFSEQFSLSDAERETLTTAILDHVAGRVPVIVTTTHYGTRICAAAQPPCAAGRCQPW